MNFEEALVLLKDGKKVRRIREESDYEDVIIWFDKYHHIVEGDGTISDSTYILKLEDVFATNWEEYKEPLLTEREKRYLEEIINFSPAEAADISEFKIEDHLSSNRKLIAFYNKDNRVIMEILIKEDCLKGLEKNTSYTLKELELDEPL